MLKVFARAARMFAVVLLLVLIASVLHGDAGAQDEAGAGATPVVADDGAAATGTLAVNIFTCVDGEAAPEIVEAASDCPEAGAATLWIDGAGPNELQDGAALTLSAGDHVVSTSADAAGVSVSIVEGETATVLVVTHVAAPAAPTTSLTIVTHQCQDKIKYAASFEALGDFSAKLARCPAASRPYDFTVDDGGEAPLTLADAAKKDDGYVFAKIAKGPVTLVETTAPDGAVFGAAALAPDDDASALTSVDPAKASMKIDLTHADDLTLHIFNFAKPAVKRVSIVNHVCASITAKADFEALGNFAKQALACLVVTLPGDSGPAGLPHADHAAFDFTVKDANGTERTLSEAAFTPEDLCETDIQQELNDDGQIEATTCLDGSRYQFDKIAQGAGVLVTETTPPEGFRIGDVSIAPGGAGQIGKVDLKERTIKLNTTETGDVTIHVFNFAVPAPAAEFGSVQVVKLWCDGASDETVVKALAPGAQATQDDLGDASCVAGGADFTISQFGGDPGAAFNAGESGMIVIPNLPVTSGSTGPHVIAELSTGAHATFEIAPDETTRVIFLNYTAAQVDDNSGGVVDESAGGDASGEAVDGPVDAGAFVEENPAAAADVPADGSAASDVAGGDDLPDTGVRPAHETSGDRLTAILILGAASALLLTGAGLARRRMASAPEPG